MLVLIAHLIVLSKAIGVVAVDHSPPLKALVTRVIVPAPPLEVPAVVEPPPEPTPKPKPAPSPIPKPRAAIRQVAPPPVETQVAQVAPPTEIPAAPIPVDSASAPAVPASAPSTAPTAPAAVEPTPAIAQIPAANAPAAQTRTASIAPNPSVPGSAILSYQVQGLAKGFSYNAASTLEWKQDGDRYDLKYRVGAFLIGERVQTSYGKLGKTGLEPERFSDKTRSEVATHFDREKSVVIFSNNAPSVPLTAGAQDRLSIFMQLSALLAGQGAKASASTFSMQILSGRDSDVWTFTSTPAEMISLPVGETSAIKVTRKPRKEFDQTVELWFAPEMGWIPVRLRISEANGDFLDQKLKSVTNP